MEYKQTIESAKTVEQAIEQGCNKLGVDRDECTIDILKQPKKGFFGLFKAEAQVQITTKTLRIKRKDYSLRQHTQVDHDDVYHSENIKEVEQCNHDEKIAYAISFLTEILKEMDLSSNTIRKQVHEYGATLIIEGESLGLLIGRHGETLDALQYLTNLVCNQLEGKYIHIILDCGNYREKRKQILKKLAQNIANQVKKRGYNQEIEPMSRYERRIIHDEISMIVGVGSKSVGNEPNRGVLVFLSNKKHNYIQSSKKNVTN